MSGAPDDLNDGQSRKERERSQHRRDILTAGEKIFAQKGYFNATIEEIAREAEFSVGTIYNFFSNKETLYQEIIRSIVETSYEDFRQEIVPVPDPVQAIRLLVRLRIRQFEQHQGLFHVIVENMPTGRFNPALMMPPECLHYHERYFEELCAICARGRALGIFSDEEPLTLALALEGLLNTFAAYWFKQRPEHVTSQKITTLDRMVFRALGCENHKI